MKCGDSHLDLSHTLVMGIVNLTPDSFSAVGRFSGVDAAVAHAESLLSEGAAVLDLGAESTRPSADPVDVATEKTRLLPVVKALVRRDIRNISIDTRNAETARAALGEGASWINDVTALSYDPLMVQAAQQADGVVLMHARGTPKTMQTGVIHYDNVEEEVRNYLSHRIAFCEQNGIARSRLLIDPGIGFGKTAAHNLKLLNSVPDLVRLGCPVLVGLSRKSLVGQVLNAPDPADRLFGSLGGASVAAWLGAKIVRVHDVKATVQALKMVDAIRSTHA